MYDGMTEWSKKLDVICLRHHLQVGNGNLVLISQKHEISSRPTMTPLECRCTKGLRHGKSLAETYHISKPRVAGYLRWVMVGG